MEERLRREEEIERMMLEHEQEELWQEQPHAPPPPPPPPNEPQPPMHHPPPIAKSPKISYIQASFGAAAALIWYALRTRHQWYLALVFLGSSKWAYIVLGNALIALYISIFRFLTRRLLGGLRLVESEGLADYFRWNITDTCLALTMFRSELDVQSAVVFLMLILGKCLHWVVDARESHLRMTQDAIVPVPPGNLLAGWPALQTNHCGLLVTLLLLLVMDVVAVVYCVQDIAQHGMSVQLMFGFEAAILFVTAMSLIMLWFVHFVDGWLHYLHDETSVPIQGLLHAWKDRKATLIFAVEVQAQGAKFLFYCTFFAIVLNFYGLPLNLFREVYMSFQSLRGRLIAFTKYRRLMAGLNRFRSLETEEELEEAGRICIICRDEMTLRDSKQLPGCGHVFHKSCLREWLVQQQTCPTCRGDIAANERREQQQRELSTWRQQQQEQQQQEQQQQEEEQEEAAQEQQQELPRRQAAVPTPRARAAPTAPVERDLPAPGVVAAPRDLMAELEEDDEEEEEEQLVQPIARQVPVTTPPPSTTSTMKRTLLQSQQEPSSFPALYKIVAHQDALVMNVDENRFVRAIPGDSVILCYEQKEMNMMMMGGERTDMLRIPDGWVKAGLTERLVAIS